MSQSIQIQQSTRLPFETLWWRPILSMQRDLNRALRDAFSDSPTPILNPTLWDAEVDLFESLQRNTHRLFCELFNNRQMATSILTGSMPEPNIEIVENGANFKIKAGVPGTEAEDLEVSIADGALIISGTRSEACSDTVPSFLRQECHDGVFSRIIALPEEADLNQARASLENNELTVVVPKRLAIHLALQSEASAVSQMA